MKVADYGVAANASLENHPGDVQGIGSAAPDVGGARAAPTPVMGANGSLDRAQVRPVGSHTLTGVVGIHDAKSNDVAFALPDISSIGDLTRDLRRRVDLLESWARQNSNTESE